MPRTPAQRKGDSLEAAVHSIEETILRLAPGFAEGTFKILNKHVVVTQGVHHEIDLFVVASMPTGYESTFIFECKNWQSKVGKNEIIVFSEKIAASAATRGFFVANSFSKDARAQAKKDARVKLLLASYMQPVVRLKFPQFIHIHLGKTDVHIQVGLARREGAVPAEQFVFAGKVLRVGGEAFPMESYVNQWAEHVRQEEVNIQKVGERADGPYTISIHATRSFNPGEAYVDEESVLHLALTGTAEVTVVRAAVLSIFEVASRGRLLKLGIDHAGLEIRADVVEIAE